MGIDHVRLETHTNEETIMADLLTDQLRTDYGTLSYGLISDASGYTFGEPWSYEDHATT